MEKISDLFRVKIDFSRSHLLFPSIVEWVLVGLLITIVIMHGRELAAYWRTASPLARLKNWQFDKRRLLGCLALTPIYFLLMEPVGRIYPNSGIGFLLTSCVYGFALSWLFVRDNSRRKMVLMGLNALITPTAVWFVFAHIFRITLP